MNDDLAKLVTAAAATRTFTQKWNELVTEIERRLGTSRRNFMAALIGTAGAAMVDPTSMLSNAAIDPEVILPSKTIIIPSQQVLEGYAYGDWITAPININSRNPIDTAMHHHTCNWLQGHLTGEHVWQTGAEAHEAWVKTTHATTIEEWSRVRSCRNTYQLDTRKNRRHFN